MTKSALTPYKIEGMEKINKSILWGVIASETIHVFCCVLPTLFSVFSLLAGMGMIATMPGFIEEAHHMIHNYEVPMIIFSAIILMSGWGLYIYSRQINCRTEGTCSHEPCEPKKDRIKLIMIGATILFVFNVSVYFFAHAQSDAHIEHDAEHNHNHAIHQETHI